MENTPTILDNFLPETIAENLFDFVNKLQWSYGWKSNPTGFAHWNCDIAKASMSNGLDVTKDIQDEQVLAAWNFIKSEYLPDYSLIRCYANSHTFGVEGYPHTDSKRDQDITVVVYMNKNWRREWGGETLIYDGDTIVKGALPAFNRAVIFKGNQYHCARSVSRTCPDTRRTIMFKCAKVNADSKRDSLQRFLETVGAQSKEHSSSVLINHLLFTYDLLKAANQSDDICLAGGAHSLYGTSKFKDACLAMDDTVGLRSVIGDAPLELVKLFATVNRPAALEQALARDTRELSLTAGGSVIVTDEQFYALCAMDAANLYEQTTSFSFSKSFPNLSKFWAKIYKE